MYRVSAKALIKNNQGQLLFAEEREGHGLELPGGGIENNESLEVALKRELKEELGIDSSIIAKSPTYIWIISGKVMWLIYEVSLAKNQTILVDTEHIASAKYYDIASLTENSNPPLGYVCNLYKNDLIKYISDNH